MPPFDRSPAGSQPLSRPARLAAAALSKRWQLPAATNEVRVLRGVDVPMRDGTVLRADVYLPASARPAPHRAAALPVRPRRRRSPSP